MIGYAADDIAAVHGECAAADDHAAAFHPVGEEDPAARAACDDATIDGLCTAVVQHPRFCAVNLEFVLRRGIAVDKGQVAGDAALIIEDNNAAAAGHFQNIAVEIEGDLAEDGQGAADVDILRQPDDIRRTVRQSGDQLLFRFDFPVCLTRGKRRSRHKAEQHT